MRLKELGKTDKGIGSQVDRRPFILKVKENPRLQNINIGQTFKDSVEESKMKHKTVGDMLEDRTPMICYLKNKTLSNFLVANKK